MLSNESAEDSQITNTEVEFDAGSGEIFSAEQIQLLLDDLRRGIICLLILHTIAGSSKIILIFDYRMVIIFR